MSTSAAEQVKSILEAGTWTNYQAIYAGKTPKVIILLQDQKIAKSPHQGIALRDVPFEPSYAFTGDMILGPRDIEMEIYARNDTDRDAIWEDVKAIFKASTYDITMHEIDTPSKRNRYRNEMIATILL